MATTRTVHELARWARAAVRTPMEATLAVDDVNRTGHDDGILALSDVEGMPTVHCSIDSALAGAARAGAGAVLKVRSDVAGPPGTWVRLSGSLAVADIHLHLPVPRMEVRLVPLFVSVHSGESDTRGAVVPLAAYDGAVETAPDLPSVADAFVAHSRECHGTEVRAFVARRMAIPVEAVAAAELTSVDELGAEVSWVDARGAHRIDLPFAAPARCPHQIAEALRATFDA
ncbi:hypothetical protein JQN72_12640 [Phycicoccus sp. CSK15P-2]|uniref:hypothetical protein n=1 Tax=Phycicoccus sp. CSK15P-2 TaxID=2807627 RepID=UPI00195111CD|nr:hypothetical protein [Phycicoccus sp. CSK15P-2]MBM6403626.1 hypothetical protein [Phycicoccus sp. CSK15P-2]MBM6405091.1 hypothetical protein [Phycicoccus sp. CSK15P-2]